MTIEQVAQSEMTVDVQKCCSNCNRTYDKPELVQYYVCPHCHVKIEKKQKMGCPFWFGYMSQKEKDQPIPKECIECERVVECMLTQYYGSEKAVTEIKKWY